MEGGHGCDAVCSYNALPRHQALLLGAGGSPHWSERCWGWAGAQPFAGVPPTAAGTNTVICSSLELDLAAGAIALGLMDLRSWGKDGVRGEQG